MWPKEVDSKYCLNYVKKDQNSQIACQSLCLESRTCVGISTSPSVCYLCNDDELTTGPDGYAFYRRKGITT